MSRIGKLPVTIPDGVQVTLQDNVITVKGPKGELTRELHNEMEVVVEDKQVIIMRPSDSNKHKALHGLTRTLVNNMVEGVTKGYQKTLELVGVGYRAQMQGKKLVLQVGYSHPVEIEPGKNLEIEVPAPTKVIVKGIDKEEVGTLAANIRAVREPEPYKGKGIRYEGERIKLKAGKAGAKK
ncbi:MAG: large subunit ribosomal protein [Clostridia bacterium]|jgi:large subunit ribosomal protein L6|nr:large subunit ribosomal protein [Clostridia bacterium]MDN5323233.1 large subunit ribosomal protein [Clostridia bacterium]